MRGRGLKAGRFCFRDWRFRAMGRAVFASLASETDPAGEKKGDTGSGVAVYSFLDGVLAPVRVMKIPGQMLAEGKTTLLGKEKGSGVPYPAALAVVGPTYRDGARDECGILVRIMNFEDGCLSLTIFLMTCF